MSFRQSVRAIFRRTSNEPVFSGTADHCKIVLEEALAAAQTHVRILSHGLDRRCYDTDEVIAAAQEFLRRHGRLTILTETAYQAGVETGRFVRTVARYPEQVEVSTVRPSLTSTYSYNFLVVDEFAYQFEKNRLEHVAVVGSSAPGVKNLLNIFEVIRAQSVLEKLPEIVTA